MTATRDGSLTAYGPSLWRWAIAAALFACAAPAAEPTPGAEDLWAAAERNGEQANDALARCHAFVQGWWPHRDEHSNLLPQNLRSRVWTGANSAADLWPFMVLTCYVTDRALLDGRMRDILHDEIRLTTRVGRLPDDYSFERRDFVRPEPMLDRIIFGASEYVKDGLLPITEVMGRDEWFHRMRGIVEDICTHAPVQTQFGPIPSGNAEVNGEMLQSLCRLYGMTADPRFMQMALRIGDAYFLEVLPGTNGLPCHSWDFSTHKPTRDALSLNDHGNEIIGGLSEVFVLAHFHRPAKAKAYEAPMRRMLDVLAAEALNSDGLWYRSIRPTTREILSKSTPDTWGYPLNAYYTFYMVTGDEGYRRVVQRALENINQPRYKKWGGADAFADSIESGIVLLNRLPVPAGFAWLEDVVQPFLAKQRDTGIIEGWHGDGNYARTALMYALYKTQGLRVSPWSKALRFGACMGQDGLHVHLHGAADWQGRLLFDRPRHRDHMGLPINYPRLNEFPEWFVVQTDRLYSVTDVDQRSTRSLMGGTLLRGLPVSLKAGERRRFLVRPHRGAPYGGKPFAFTGANVVGTDGALSYRCELRNLAAEPIRLAIESSWGALSAGSLQVPGGESAAVTLSGRTTESMDVKLTASDGTSTTVWPLRILCEPGLVALMDCHNRESYMDETYRWTGEEDIEVDLPARPGRDHVLWLRWGAKGGERTGILTVNGSKRTLTAEGYRGFRWVKVEVPAQAVRDGRVRGKLTKGGPGRPAFVSQIKLTLANPD